jgi:hypothetical protein
MEALGDAIIFCEPPHGRQRFAPGLKSLGQSDQRGKGTLPKLADEFEQGGGQRATSAIGLVLEAHKRAQGMHFFIQGRESGIAGKELEQALVVPGIEMACWKLHASILSARDSRDRRERRSWRNENQFFGDNCHPGFPPTDDQDGSVEQPWDRTIKNARNTLTGKSFPITI